MFKLRQLTFCRSFVNSTLFSKFFIVLSRPSSSLFTSAETGECSRQNMREGERVGGMTDIFIMDNKQGVGLRMCNVNKIYIKKLDGDNDVNR